MTLAAHTMSNTNVHNAQPEECQCLPTNGAPATSCSSIGKTVDVCTAIPNCNWGPTTDATCQAEIKKFQDGILPQPVVCQCYGNDQASETVCKGFNFGVDVCVANSNCHWGPGEDKQCRDELEAFWNGVLPEKEDPKDESEDKDVTSVVNELNSTWNEMKEGLLKSGIVSKEELEGLTEMANVAVQAVESLIDMFSNMEFAQ